MSFFLGGDSFGEDEQVETGESSREKCRVQAGIGVPAGSLGVPPTGRQQGKTLLIKGNRVDIRFGTERDYIICRCQGKI